MTTYSIEEIDDIWTILKDGEFVGRVVSKRDGDAILEQLDASGTDDLRDRLLSAVIDAIEDAFDSTA